VSFDFADKAVEDFHFLFPASVLTFDRFMDKDFFNQRIQKFSRQFCGIDILFHQTYPLFSVNRCLGGGLHRFVKPFNFYVQFSLFALILFGQLTPMDKETVEMFQQFAKKMIEQAGTK
jgi:hypothetical protein